MVKNLIFVFAYWFTITIGLKSEKSVGVPYIAWLAVGLVPWFFIRDTLVPAARSIRSNRYLVTKVVFPKSIISTFKVLSGFMSSFMFLGSSNSDLFIVWGFPYDLLDSNFLLRFCCISPYDCNFFDDINTRCH